MADDRDQPDKHASMMKLDDDDRQMSSLLDELRQELDPLVPYPHRVFQILGTLDEIAVLLKRLEVAEARLEIAGAQSRCVIPGCALRGEPAMGVTCCSCGTPLMIVTHREAMTETKPES
jgi:hypothetical protein